MNQYYDIKNKIKNQEYNLMIFGRNTNNITGPPNVVINIENVNMEQPREMNIEIGNTIFTNTTSSTSQNLTDFGNNTRRAVVVAEYDNNRTNDRVNDKYLETFYNNSHLLEGLKDAVRQSNISYFVHKVLSKRNADQEFSLGDMEVNGPHSDQLTSNDLTSDSNDLTPDTNDRTPDSNDLTFTYDTKVFYDTDESLVARLKKEDIVIDNYEAATYSKCDTNKTDLPMTTETMTTTTNLDNDHDNSNADCHNTVTYNPARNCSEAEDYIKNYCSSQNEKSGTTEISITKPNPEFFETHKKDLKKKKKVTPIAVKKTSPSVDCCKVADAIEILKMLNRILRMKDENINVLAITRLNRDQ